MLGKIVVSNLSVLSSNSCDHKGSSGAWIGSYETVSTLFGVQGISELPWYIHHPAQSLSVDTLNPLHRIASLKSLQLDFLQIRDAKWETSCEKKNLIYCSQHSHEGFSLSILKSDGFCGYFDVIGCFQIILCIEHYQFPVCYRQYDIIQCIECGINERQ